MPTTRKKNHFKHLCIIRAKNYHFASLSTYEKLWNDVSKMLLVNSFLCFHDQFVASMKFFGVTSFELSNLRLVVLIKVVIIKKSVVWMGVE